MKKENETSNFLIFGSEKKGKTGNLQLQVVYIETCTLKNSISKVFVWFKSKLEVDFFPKPPMLAAKTTLSVTYTLERN